MICDNREMYQRTYQQYIDKLASLRTTNSTTRRLLTIPQHKLIPTNNKEPIGHQDKLKIKSQQITKFQNASSNLRSVVFTRKNLRYKSQQAQAQSKQDLGGAKAIRCKIPGAKVRALQLCFHHISSNLQQTSQQHPKNNNQILSQKWQSAKRLSHSTSKNKTKQELKSTELILQYSPQKNANRTVIYKQTFILSATQSCLFQLSILNNFMLISAYLMGIQNNCLTLLLSKRKTRSIITHYRQNYSSLFADITFKNVNGLYCAITLVQKERDKFNSPYQERLPDKKNATHQQNNKTNTNTRKCFIIGNSQQKLTQQPNTKAKPKLNNRQLCALITRLHPAKRTTSFKSISNDSASERLKYLGSMSTKKAQKGLLNSVKLQGKNGRLMKSSSNCDIFVDSQLALQRNRLKINNFIEQSYEIYSVEESDQTYHNEFIEEYST